ncbi:hypothetical protein P7H17_17355 [Paenibacillus larvae]|nr:hypothetical protein [Paenibacillus larvae]MDT2287466.1 hypothetical protein [Paenibacillus larvae]
MAQVGKWAVAAGGITVSYFFGGWGLRCAGYIPLAVILNYLTGRVTGFIEGGLNFIDR